MIQIKETNKKFGGIGIRTKLIIYFLVLVLLVSAVNIFIIRFLLYDNLSSELLERVNIAAKSLSVHLTEPVLSGDKDKIIDLIFSEKFSRKDIAYVIVFDDKNNLIASTFVKENPADFLRKNILGAGKLENMELFQTDTGEIYDFASRFAYNKGVLRVGYYRNQINSAVDKIIFFMTISALAPIFFAVIIAFFLAGMILAPINELKETAVEIAAGNIKKRAVVKSSDEIGYLAVVFNQMVDGLEKFQKELDASNQQLRASEQQLRAANQQLRVTTHVLEDERIGLEKKVKLRTQEIENAKMKLEELVQERTKELKKKLKESEKFQELVEGREEKMIELKKKIKELEEKLKNIEPREAS